MRGGSNAIAAEYLFMSISDRGGLRPVSAMQNNMRSSAVGHLAFKKVIVSLRSFAHEKCVTRRFRILVNKMS